MKKLIGVALLVVAMGAGCADTQKKPDGGNDMTATHYTAQTRIADMTHDPVFGNWGRLIFPVHGGYYGGTTLGNLSLTWYRNINAAHTVEICNYFKEQTLAGNQVFFDIYTEAEKAADPRKADTGLFFFRGEKNAKFAVTCAGGRMAATIASYGVQAFGGGADIPKPSTAVIQYTGHTDYNRSGEPATFVCVGESDGIADYRTMKSRIDRIAAMGVPTEYHSYAGMGHGFGLGIGTAAEGWFDQAVAFWEKNNGES